MALQYVYSAWAPQFADKLKLSATQSNLIGLAGNLGMYSMGVPIGMFIDTRGPRPAVIAGSILLALGYFPLRQAYVKGSGSVTFLCLVSYLTGLGGCMAFAAAVKTSALNWPHHRGTATAFPLAAFGLSAFFFSLFGSLVVPGDTSAFLLLLAIGTFVLTFVSFFFLHVLPPTSSGHAHYHSVSTGGGDDDGLSDSQQLRRTISEEAKLARRGSGGGRGRGRGHYYQQTTEEPGRSLDNDDDDSHINNHNHNDSHGAYEDEVDRGTEGGQKEDGDEDEDDGDLSLPKAPQPAATTYVSHYASIGSGNGGSSSASGSASTSDPFNPSAAPLASEDADQDLMDETSSLVSKASSLPGEILLQNSVDMDQSHRVDIRGWKLLRNVEFWQFFAIMGILAGIGLMTIK